MNATTDKLEVDEVYDPEDDIMYVSFKTGEPSYCIELDDLIMIEVGEFSRMPTGFRILDYHKRKRLIVETIKESLEKLQSMVTQQAKDSIQQREAAAEQATAAGLDVVMNRCMKIEHARFYGGLNLVGMNTGVISARRTLS